MKRIIWTVCAVTMTAILLCACDQDTKKTVGDDLATIASEVKENVDGMMEDGTVKDGDGYIGEDKTERDVTEETQADTTEDNTDGGLMNDGSDIFDDEPTDADEML